MQLPNNAIANMTIDDFGASYNFDEITCAPPDEKEYKSKQRSYDEILLSDTNVNNSGDNDSIFESGAKSFFSHSSSTGCSSSSRTLKTLRSLESPSQIRRRSRRGIQKTIMNRKDTTKSLTAFLNNDREKLNAHFGTASAPAPAVADRAAAPAFPAAGDDDDDTPVLATSAPAIPAQATPASESKPEPEPTTPISPQIRKLSRSDLSVPHHRLSRQSSLAALFQLGSSSRSKSTFSINGSCHQSCISALTMPQSLLDQSQSQRSHDDDDDDDEASINLEDLYNTTTDVHQDKSNSEISEKVNHEPNMDEPRIARVSNPKSIDQTAHHSLSSILSTTSKSINSNLSASCSYLSAQTNGSNCSSSYQERLSKSESALATTSPMTQYKSSSRDRARRKAPKSGSDSRRRATTAPNHTATDHKLHNSRKHRHGEAKSSHSRGEKNKRHQHSIHSTKEKRSSHSRGKKSTSQHAREKKSSQSRGNRGSSQYSSSTEKKHHSHPHSGEKSHSGEKRSSHHHRHHHRRSREGDNGAAASRSSPRRSSCATPKSHHHRPKLSSTTAEAGHHSLPSDFKWTSAAEKHQNSNDDNNNSTAITKIVDNDDSLSTPRQRNHKPKVRLTPTNSNNKSRNKNIRTVYKETPDDVDDTVMRLGLSPRDATIPSLVRSSTTGAPRLPRSSIVIQHEKRANVSSEQRMQHEKKTRMWTLKRQSSLSQAQTLKRPVPVLTTTNNE